MKISGWRGGDIIIVLDCCVGLTQCVRWGDG